MGFMIRVAIVEDKKEHAESLNGFLDRFGKERGQEFSVDFFCNGMDFISDYNSCYDIVFMDIEMPHMNGMDCAFRLRRVDKNVALIFVTGMAQYAVKGYEVEAIGYIVKPLTYFPFAVLMDKVIKKIEEDTSKEIYLGTGDHIKRIFLRDLYYVEVLDHYLIYHTTEGEFREIGRMKDAEQILGEHHFFRCSNCYLVNMLYVWEINDTEITVGKDKIFISRRRKKAFMNAINDFLKRGGRK